MSATQPAVSASSAATGGAVRGETQQLQAQQHHALQDAGSVRWPVVCPICGGDASRIPLQRSGMWLSLLVTVRRFRCHSARCGWNGNLFG